MSWQKQKKRGGEKLQRKKNSGLNRPSRGAGQPKGKRGFDSNREKRFRQSRAAKKKTTKKYPSTFKREKNVTQEGMKGTSGPEAMGTKTQPGVLDGEMDSNKLTKKKG